MSVAINPYAPPKARVDDVGAHNSAAEAIRFEHIKRETSIRSIGLLYYLSGVVMTLAAIGLFVAAVDGSPIVWVWALGPAYLLFGVLSIFLARGLRKLQRWARTTTLVMAGIGLLAFPVGTLLNGYILYLLLSQQGKRIFEPDYAQIVADTPHVKYRTSIVVWIALGILVLAIVALLASFAMR